MFGIGGKRLWKEQEAGSMIYDRVAEEAGPCFIAVNDGVAVRYYRQLIEKNGVVAQDEYVVISSWVV